MWDILVTAVDAWFGGNWCFRENPGRSDYPSLVREYPPYPGRSRYVSLIYISGKAYEVGGNRAWWIPESGKLDPGITGPVDKQVREITGPGENRSEKWSLQQKLDLWTIIVIL